LALVVVAADASSRQLPGCSLGWRPMSVRTLPALTASQAAANPWSELAITTGFLGIRRRVSPSFLSAPA
jgi:hypothetical protein